MSNQALPFKLGEQLERALTVQRSDINVEARTVTLAFASETPVERYYGFEILDCSTSAIRMKRMLSGANLLCDHDSRDVVGVVESVSVGADKVVRAVVRFGKSERAEEVFQDVVDGIRQNVSVGYMMHEGVRESEKDGVGTYRITDWEPFEVSMVSIPADTAVGVGRSVTEPAVPAATPPVITQVITPPTQKENRTMDPVATPAATPAAAPVIQTPATRNHAQEISAFAATTPALADAALRSIQAGHTMEQFQTEAIRVLATKPLPTADIGMTNKEKRNFSVLRAINSMANPGDHALRQAAAFEFECSAAVGKIMGRSAQGFFIPYDVLGGQKRDLTVANASSAGYSVDTTLLADSGNFIDMLRARMVTGGLGMRYMTGLVGDIDILRQTGTASAYWLAEQAGPTKSNQSVDKLHMTPKTVGAKTIISRKLRQQSSLDAENFARTDLNICLALAMEDAILNGTGAANTITGLFNTAGIGDVAGGTNGAAPTWGHIVDLETAISVLNADIGSMSYLVNAKTRGKLKKTFVDAGSNAERVWDKGDLPLNGYGAAVTNLVPSNVTKGSGTNLSKLLFGNFGDAIVAMWGGLDVLVDPYTGGDAGDVSIRLLQDMDFGVRHVESFASMKDAITA